MPNGGTVRIAAASVWLCSCVATSAAYQLTEGAGLDLIAGEAAVPVETSELPPPSAYAASPDPGGRTPGLNTPTSTVDYNRGGLFDEVRLGGGVFVKSDVPDAEDGVFLGGEVLLDPFVARLENAFANVVLRPRPHVGATIAAGDGTSVLYAGLTWDLPLVNPLFLEATLGGAIHDGDLHPPAGSDELELGCRVVFRESLGLGADLGRWRVVTAVDHASNAGLCEGNDGLTHATASLGYRF